jgi:hypothetical protein
MAVCIGGQTFPFIISFMVISSYSSSTGCKLAPFSGRGGSGKQFRIFFSLTKGAPLTGELDPELQQEDAALDEAL